MHTFTCTCDAHERKHTPRPPLPPQLVRLGPDGREQLVLLDHGLYKRLDDTFRWARGGAGWGRRGGAGRACLGTAVLLAVAFCLCHGSLG
jgi:hypothetical protein